MATGACRLGGAVPGDLQAAGGGEVGDGQPGGVPAASGDVGLEAVDASPQIRERQLEVSAFQVPQGDVDGGDGAGGQTGAAEIAACPHHASC
jgi:hypothetical protein